MKLIYTANARIPSEKAHPYQIVQMCEAFAGQGAEVTLLYANRRNPPELRTDDIWGHYGAGATQLYTSAGVGHWFPFRLGCPPEAPLFILESS